MTKDSYIALEYAVDAIQVGVRHRKDLGDIDALAKSIQDTGLLHLITITRDGVLICGARRLAAIKQLGWRKVNVWVRADISERLTALMAERDDMISHKTYNAVEQAELYAELKAEIAADAARRQAASRFGAETGTQNGRSHGEPNFGSPCDLGKQEGGNVQKQAAKILNGASHTTLEKIEVIKALADDETADRELRRQARLALAELADGAAVHPTYQNLQAKLHLDELEQAAEDETLAPEARASATEALALIRKASKKQPLSADGIDRIAKGALNRVHRVNRNHQPPASSTGGEVLPKVVKKCRTKTFIWTWDELHSWPADYDVETIAREVPDDKWARFEQTMREANEFMAAVNNARANQAAPA